MTRKDPDTPVARHFTDRTRKVLAMAKEETIRCQHDSVGTEHILLGLMGRGSVS